jgi:hypothetical protein
MTALKAILIAVPLFIVSLAFTLPSEIGLPGFY